MDPLPGQLGFFDAQPVGDEVLAWRGFSADHPVADAVAQFRQRFGCEPERILQDRGILLLGPVPAGRDR